MNKKTNTVILWLIAIGLLLGMIITFTPNLGFGGGSVASARGDVVLKVNGEPVTDLEINQLRNSNPLYYAVTEGEVGDEDRKSTRLNSSHVAISYAVFCLKIKI